MVPTLSTAISSTPILLGACSWTAKGWKGAFYPSSTKAADFLPFYARHFPTAEIDSTFYAIPPPASVEGWADRTPEGFVFAAKVPRIITHDRIMEGAVPDLLQFCKVMEALGPRLGPLLLQFPYFNHKQFANEAPFLARLKRFLPELPTDFQWALEIRNRSWIGRELLDMLRQYRVAFTLIDHPWMPTPSQLQEQVKDVSSLVTGPCCYVRWLGDRKKLDAMTETWDRTLVDRVDDLQGWVQLLGAVAPMVQRTYAYANNHYAGYSPDTLRQFNDLWGGGLLSGVPEDEGDSLIPSTRDQTQLTLF